MTQKYEWTLDDVRDAKRRAEWKRLEWSEASDTAEAMECEYWTQQLVQKFSQLKYKTEDSYIATIAFRHGDEICRVRGPKKYEYCGTEVLVWHKGSKGKFNKLATRYQCEEIVPFITAVSLPTAKEEAVS